MATQVPVGGDFPDMQSTTSVWPQMHSFWWPGLAHLEVNTQRSVSRHIADSVSLPPFFLPGTVSHRPDCWLESRQPLFSAQGRQSSARPLSISLVFVAAATRAARAEAERTGRALPAELPPSPKRTSCLFDEREQPRA